MLGKDSESSIESFQNLCLALSALSGARCSTDPCHILFFPTPPSLVSKQPVSIRGGEIFAWPVALFASIAAVHDRVGKERSCGWLWNALEVYCTSLHALLFPMIWRTMDHHILKCPPKSVPERQYQDNQKAFGGG